MREFKLTMITLVLIIAISLAINYLVKADHSVNYVVQENHTVYEPTCEENGGRFVPVGFKPMIFICKVEK